MSEPESEPLRRSAQEVAQRVLALLTVTGKVHDPDQAAAWMTKHGLERYLSPAETEFVEQQSPSQQSRINFSWRAEAVVSLLWALRGLPEMPPFGVPFDIFGVEMVKAAFKDPQAFLAQARLRSEEEIEVMESHLYHQHWRVRDRDLGFNVGKTLAPEPGETPIEELNSGIVQERRYGLTWLVNSAEWDDVPLDT